MGLLGVELIDANDDDGDVVETASLVGFVHHRVDPNLRFGFIRKLLLKSLCNG